jgi:hypothetical protein
MPQWNFLNFLAQQARRSPLTMLPANSQRRVRVRPANDRAKRPHLVTRVHF